MEQPHDESIPAAAEQVIRAHLGVSLSWIAPGVRCSLCWCCCFLNLWCGSRLLVLRARANCSIVVRRLKQLTRPRQSLRSGLNFRSTSRCSQATCAGMVRMAVGK